MVLILASGCFSEGSKASNEVKDTNVTWLLTRDHILDGVLDATSANDEVELRVELNRQHNRFIGSYTTIMNDSIFSGEIYSARGTTLINFFQYDQTFYVIHIGQEIEIGRFIGTWFASGGLSGDFEIKKE